MTTNFDSAARRWSLGDLVRTQRNQLQEKSRILWGEYEITNAKLQEFVIKKLKEDPPEEPVQEEHLAEQRLTYPYTKGIDLTNDGMGYGEEVSVRVCVTPHGERATLVCLSGRRTRTGLRPSERSD